MSDLYAMTQLMKAFGDDQKAFSKTLNREIENQQALRSMGSMRETIVEVGPEAFADKELTVISFRGRNYYRACDAVVLESSAGNTHCVRRIGHINDYHEDYDGHVKFSPIRQCKARNLHGPHTYKYNHLSTYVEASCPGNDGTKP